MLKIMYNFFDRIINLCFYFSLIYIVFKPNLQLVFTELNNIFHPLIKYRSLLLIIFIVFSLITKNIHGLLRISIWIVFTSIILLVGSTIAYNLNEFFWLYSLITLKILLMNFIENIT